MSTTLRVALAQTTTGLDPAANAETLTDAIATAAGHGAAILFTPEMSGLLDRDRNRAGQRIVAEADDRVLASVRSAAAQHRIWVQLGSLALQGEDGDERFSNCAVLIDDTGAIRARYDKMHLFDAEVREGEHYRESAAYAAGDGPVVAETPWGRLGLTICYDLRFAPLYGALADAGADLLAVPAAFTVPTGRAHWHVLLRARAIETGCFVIAAAQFGCHADGRETFGHSLVVDPWGEVLLDMGAAPGVACVDLDLAAVGEARRRLPTLSHRRAIGPVRVAP